MSKLMPIVNGNAIDMKFKSDKANQSTSLGKGYIPSERYDDTTPSRTFTNASLTNRQRGEYRMWEGDTPVYYRAGSLDYRDKPSKELR